MATWTVVVEGESDRPVAEAILAAYGHEVGPVYGPQGKGAIDKNLRAWCAAGRQSRWLVMRDLDQDQCAPSLLARIAPRSGGMVRIAVRAIETWLLADPERVAKWLGIARVKVPRDVEDLPDPKAVLIGLARKSRSKTVREDIVPRDRARIGPGYVDQVRVFCRGVWRPEVAAGNAPSLRRCLEFIGRRGSGPLAV